MAHYFVSAFLTWVILLPWRSRTDNLLHLCRPSILRILFLPSIRTLKLVKGSSPPIWSSRLWYRSRNTSLNVVSKCWISLIRLCWRLRSLRPGSSAKMGTAAKNGHRQQRHRYHQFFAFSLNNMNVPWSPFLSRLIRSGYFSFSCSDLSMVIAPLRPLTPAARGPGSPEDGLAPELSPVSDMLLFILLVDAPQ